MHAYELIFVRYCMVLREYYSSSETLLTLITSLDAKAYSALFSVTCFNVRI